MWSGLENSQGTMSTVLSSCSCSLQTKRYTVFTLLPDKSSPYTYILPEESKLTLYCGGLLMWVSTRRDYAYRLAYFLILLLADKEKQSPNLYKWQNCSFGGPLWRANGGARMQFLQKCKIIMFFTENWSVSISSRFNWETNTECGIMNIYYFIC